MPVDPQPIFWTNYNTPFRHSASYIWSIL